MPKSPETSCFLPLHPLSSSSPDPSALVRAVQFSVIVPTLNEANDIDPLLERLSALDLPPGSLEVIFVDNGSGDGAPDKVKVRAWEKHANVRLIERRGKPDLTRAVLVGAAAARGGIIVVMDADLSHSPEELPALVAPVLDGSHDVVVGSRYVPGACIEGWSLYRQWLSRIGGWLARSICDVNDPASGFFAFRRELAETVMEQARGCRLLLEILMAGQGRLRVTEVPIRFRDRARGAAKFSLAHQWIYLQRLAALAGGSLSGRKAELFAGAGLFGVIVDALLFQWLMSRGVGLAPAHMASFFAAVGVNYFLHAKQPSRFREGLSNRDQLGRTLLVGVFALALRGGVLALLLQVWHFPPLLAIIPAIAATALITRAGSAFYVLPLPALPGKGPSPDVRWRVAAIGIIGLALLLRLTYMGVAQLIPDEAYYWNYAQRMDLSFFDHPPVVAWLIWAGTSLFGHNEFGVRFGALVCGLVTMGYLYALTFNFYDRSVAMRAALLLAVLPLGFVTATLMTPDAPLMAAWAATLYYLERALIADRRRAWLGVGIAFGLGILSKYTLGLLGFAALVFVILDPSSRRWLARPHPYLAAALALALFSPVIVWNMQHEWASILYQSNRATGIGNKFSLHLLFLHMLLVLTPVGFAAAAMALVRSDRQTDSIARRRRLFMRVFTIVPLAVFFWLSLFGWPKFHWTAPVWLALLPAMAWMLGQAGSLGRAVDWLKTGWKWTIVICMFVYAVALHYVALGIPGIPYIGFAEHYFWREATQGVQQLVREVEQQTGQKPVVVGMSKWSVSASLSFYDDQENPMDIRGRNMFLQSAAMYDFWYPSEPPTTRPIILVGMKQHQLEHDIDGNDNITPLLVQPGPIRELTIDRADGRPLRGVYYRIAEGYRGLPQN